MYDWQGLDPRVVVGRLFKSIPFKVYELVCGYTIRIYKMKSVENGSKLKVFFDGGCPLCRREIGVYKRLDRGKKIEWTDVSTQLPDEIAIDRKTLLKRFHVQSVDGVIYSGAEAFFKLWKEMPGWKWLGKLGNYGLVVKFAEMLYIQFLKVRPFLQKPLKYIDDNKKFIQPKKGNDNEDK